MTCSLASTVLSLGHQLTAAAFLYAFPAFRSWRKTHCLPEQHTDFIFSVVGEEAGFLGAGVVTLLYFTLVARGIRVAHRARNRFASLLAIGMTSIFLYHVLVNIFMTVGFAPVTGLPLPLLSYGGTSLLTSFLQVGLIQNIAMRWREY
jgi:rod shape determining protein RodA